MERLRARWQQLRFTQKIHIVVYGICLLIGCLAGWLVADPALWSLAVPGDFTYVPPTQTATPAPPSPRLGVTLPTLEAAEAQGARGRNPAPSPRQGLLGAVLELFRLDPGPTAVAEDEGAAAAENDYRDPPAPRAIDPRADQGAALDPTRRPDTKPTPVRPSPTTEPLEVPPLPPPMEP